MVAGLSVIIPAYNEAATIATAVRRLGEEIASIVSDYEIILVDDGSADATGTIIRELAMKNPAIVPVHHAKNLGKGAALAKGFQHARMDWLLFTDADLQIDMSELPAFVSAADHSDMVIGYRTGRKDSTIRRFLSKCFDLLVSLTLGVHVRDINCPFKLFRRSLVAGFEPASAGFLIDAELLHRAFHRGDRVKELGVKWHPRRSGTSSVRARHAVETVRELYALMRQR